MTSYELDPSMSGIKTFGDSAMEILKGVAHNEAEGAQAGLVAMLTDGTALFVGPPGGSKTNLAKGLLSMFEDLDESDLALIPAESDLSPSRLVGGETSHTKTVTENGIDRVESTRIEIPGIIVPTTAVVFGDEINRTNPLAVNAGLSVYSSNEIINTGGRHPMTRLALKVNTMNPSERRSGTFELAGAMASRHSAGAVVGDSRRKTVEQRHDTIDHIIHGQEPDFAAIPRIITLDQLRAMRQHVNRVIIPRNSDVDRTMKQAIVRSTDAMREMGFDEADGRFTRQVVANSRAIAALEGKPGVDVDTARRAAKMVTTARLGSLSRKAITEIPKIHELIDAA